MRQFWSALHTRNMDHTILFRILIYCLPTKWRVSKNMTLKAARHKKPELQRAPMQTAKTISKCVSPTLSVFQSADLNLNITEPSWDTVECWVGSTCLNPSSKWSNIKEDCSCFHSWKWYLGKFTKFNDFWCHFYTKTVVILSASLRVVYMWTHNELRAFYFEIYKELPLVLEQ